MTSIKILKIKTPMNIVVIITQAEQHGFTIEQCIQETDRMANSVDPIWMRITTVGF